MVIVVSFAVLAQRNALLNKMIIAAISISIFTFLKRIEIFQNKIVIFCQVFSKYATHSINSFVHPKKPTMKKFLIVTLLIFSLAGNIFAQSQPVKVLALINEATWCPVCQANGARFRKDIVPIIMRNPQIEMVKNDVSNDKTKTSSLNKLKEEGLEEFAKNNTSTGMLYFIDAKTKKLISKISIASNNEKITEEIKKAVSRS